MRKCMLFIAMPLIFSCNSGTSTTSADSTTSKPDATKEAVTYPYSINYSSQFEFADAKKSKIVLQAWKDYDNNTLDNSSANFADTVTMQLPGFVMQGSRDSVIASVKAHRSSYSLVSSQVDAVMSVKSTDKNEDWVLVWGRETDTDKKNVTDSVALHETWRFNKAGKIDYMMQYIHQLTPAKK